MRLVSFVLVLCILCSLLGSCCSVFTIEPKDSNITHNESSLDYVFNATNTVDHHLEADNIIIYGNYKNFDSSLL